MTNPLTTLALAVLDCRYLLRSRYRPRTKVRILFEYWRLTLKLILVAPLVSLRRERLVGFDVAFFDYEVLHLLFREVFVQAQYWFACSHGQPLIFDCGANVGLATLFFKWLYPRSVIHCFEPDQRTFEMLERNVRANRLSDVHLHRVALSNAVGTVAFFVGAQQAGSLIMSLDPHRSPEGDVARTLVPSAKLSAFVNGRPVDLVKMDVEGAESAVLGDLLASGAIDMVRELVVEFHHHADHRHASLAGFLHLLEEAGFDYQLDAMWRPSHSRGEFQDILLYAFRSTASSPVTQGVRM